MTTTIETLLGPTMLADIDSFVSDAAITGGTACHGLCSGGNPFNSSNVFQTMKAFDSNISVDGMADIFSRLNAKSRPDAFQRVLNALNLYVTPIIIFVGVVGNVMSFLVFSMTHLQRHSASVYLASLSLADTGFLMVLFVVWLGRLKVSLFHREGWCQATMYFMYVFFFLSVWNIVSFTAERYVIVYYPLRKDSFCTKRKSKIVVFTLTVMALSLYSFALWTSGVARFDKQVFCMPLPQYYDVLTIMTGVDTLVSWVIPSLIIIFLNVRIIQKLHQYQTRRKEMESAQAFLSDSARTQKRTVIHASLSTTGSMHIKFSSNHREGDVHDIGTGNTQTAIAPDKCQTVMRRRSQLRTARMLLILSSVFVLLSLPSHVFRIQVFVRNLLSGTAKAPKTRVRWQELFELVYFLNFAVNFFVYSVCGRHFRDGLRRLCKRITYKGRNMSCVLKHSKHEEIFVVRRQHNRFKEIFELGNKIVKRASTG